MYEWVKGVEMYRGDVLGMFRWEVGLTSLDANLLMATIFAIICIE